MTDDLWSKPPNIEQKLVFLIVRALSGVGLQLVDDARPRLSEARYYFVQEPHSFRTFLIVRIIRSGDHLEVRLRRAQRLGLHTSSDDDRVFVLDPASMDGAAPMIAMMLCDLAPSLLDRLGAVVDG